MSDGFNSPANLIAPTALPIQNCAACPPVTYQDASSHTDTSCKAYNTCSAGQYSSVAPSPTSARICASCNVGTFQDLSSFTGVSCTGCSSSSYQDQSGQAGRRRAEAQRGFKPTCNQPLFSPYSCTDVSFISPHPPFVALPLRFLIYVTFSEVVHICSQHFFLSLPCSRLQIV